MEVGGVGANIPINDKISVEVLKKSQEVVTNQISKILEDNFENTLKIQQEAAQALGAGNNINIQA